MAAASAALLAAGPGLLLGAFAGRPGDRQNLGGMQTWQELFGTLDR